MAFIFYFLLFCFCWNFSQRLKNKWYHFVICNTLMLVICLWYICESYLCPRAIVIYAKHETIFSIVLVNNWVLVILSLVTILSFLVVVQNEATNEKLKCMIYGLTTKVASKCLTSRKQNKAYSFKSCMTEFQIHHLIFESSYTWFAFAKRGFWWSWSWGCLASHIHLYIHTKHYSLLCRDESLIFVRCT